MKKLLLLLCLTQFSYSQLPSDWEIRKYNSGGGMSPKYVSPENGKVLGANVSGNPVMLTLPTGSFGTLTGVPGDNAALQAALDGKQNADNDLTTWAGITPSANVQTLLGTFNKTNANAALTDDNFAFVGTDNAFSVVQTISTAKIGATNVTGSWPYLSDSVQYRNSALTANGDAALILTGTGYTLLGASAGAEILFTVGGGSVGKVLPTGFNFALGQGIGFNTLAPSACGIRAEGSSDWYMYGTNMQFRDGGGAGRVPLAINTAAPGTVTATGILDAERIIAGSYQIGQDSSVPQIVFVGDSLTSGVAAANPYPFYLTVPTWNGFTLTQTNIGVSGYTFENIVDATHTALNPQYAHHSGLNIAVVWAGSNDLLPYTAVEVYNRASEACRYLRRHGWKVIIATVISRGDAAFDVKKNAYNTLLAANWPAFADGFASLPTTIRGDGAYNDLTYFDADKIHLNTTGQQQAAIGFDAAIDALIAAVGDVNYTGGDKGSVTVSSDGQTITLDDDSVTSAKIANGTIADGDLAGSISASKISGTALVLSSSALQSLTQATANTGYLSLAGYSLTGSNATNAIDITGTLNTTGNPAVIRINLTDTASSGSTAFLRGQVGGSTAVDVLKRGGVSFPLSSTVAMTAPGVANWAGTLGIFGTSGTLVATVSNVGLNMGGTMGLTWGSATGFWNDSAQVMAQRNGTNAQIFRIYNTFTSSTNRENSVLGWSSNVFQVGTEKGSGGGTARDLSLITDGTNRLTIDSLGRIIPVLPTSAAGLPTGALWNDAGTVKVAP